MGTMTSDIPTETAAFLANDAHRGAELAPLAYTKKSVTIEAIRFDGTLECGSRVLEFVNGRDKQGDASMTVNRPVKSSNDALTIDLQITTLEGIMTANPGDYIIRGIKGEHYPCKPDIFLGSYDRA